MKTFLLVIAALAWGWIIGKGTAAAEVAPRVERLGRAADYLQKECKTLLTP